MTGRATPPKNTSGMTVYSYTRPNGSPSTMTTIVSVIGASEMVFQASITASVETLERMSRTALVVCRLNGPTLVRIFFMAIQSSTLETSTDRTQ